MSRARTRRFMGIPDEFWIGFVIMVGFFLKLVYEIISSNPDGGLAIGYYINQWLANFYLEELDRFIVKLPGVKYYVRNMDDLILLGPNKKKLRKAVAAIREFLNKNLRIELKHNWQVFPVDSRGIDFIEVGIPFSDPLADGPVIQTAATKALHNGMSLQLLFDQLKSIQPQVHIPLILMGYLNPILHYGIEAFCQSCVEAGVSGMIIPDLPFADYLETVKPVADRYDLRVIMLITPETSEERIRFIDNHTDGFIYMVSSAAITGAQKSFDEQKQEYFRRIDQMHLRNPRMIGFGISNKQTLQAAQDNAAGAIIGSKFVTLLDESGGNADLALDLLFAALEK